MEFYYFNLLELPFIIGHFNNTTALYTAAWVSTIILFLKNKEEVKERF